MAGKRLPWLILLLLAAGVLAWLLWPKPSAPLRASLVSAAAPADASGFARAEEPVLSLHSGQALSGVEGPRPLAFPADHGPHEDYQTEWWYYTGNLTADTGEHFGYQLTFFRRALAPPDQRSSRDSAWGADQVYMAHLALTDVSGGKHYSFEKLARGAAGLAGAQAEPFRVWLEDWLVAEGSRGSESSGENESPPATDPATVQSVSTDFGSQPRIDWRPWTLRAASDDVSLDLSLRDLKGPVLQGDRGYSRKGPEPGNASYYVSLPRLATEGTITLNGRTFNVSGLSWMDHEWSTSALGSDQAGWDWFSIQLDDDTELMLFQLRRADGSVDGFSSGTLIAADGTTRTLTPGDFKLEVTDRWRSPRTTAEYPAGWVLSVPSADLQLTLTPWLADQEMDVSYAYWEGAVKAEGTRNGQPVTGNGYAELTGYAGSMRRQF
jgi:predicted secreted hydrolase